jgi:hypothetical protein
MIFGLLKYCLPFHGSQIRFSLGCGLQIPINVAPVRPSANGMTAFFKSSEQF